MVSFVATQSDTATNWHLLNASRTKFAFGKLTAGLVAMIFMHLNHEKAMIYRILVFTFFFAAGGMVLFILALLDPIKI